MIPNRLKKGDTIMMIYTDDTEELEEILENMLERHKYMIKKYYLCPLDFRKETPEQFVKNRCGEVEFYVKNNTYNMKVKVKQTCWINQEKYTCYFKTKIYINDQLTKKNVKFLQELVDMMCLIDTKVAYPIPQEEKEENKPKKKNNNDGQLSLFDFM